jgi:hypothetical protein
MREREEVSEESRCSANARTHLEDGEHAVAKVVDVATVDVMNASEQRVVHDAELLHELGVAPQLLLEQRLLLGSESKMTVTADKVEVLEDSPRIILRLLLGI